MGRLAACAELTRPVNSLMVGFAVVVGLAIVYGIAGERPPASTVLLSFATGSLISASAMVLNDLADVEIDRINAPWRPLVSGRVTAAHAKACFLALTAGGLVAAAMLGPAPFAVAFLVWLVAVVYDLWGKRSGFPGNLMVAFSTAAPFMFAMAVAGCLCREVIVFWLMVFLTVLGREIAKDIADVEGDRLAGARTLPIVLGERRAALAAAALYLAACALSPLPVLQGRVAVAPYLALVAVVDAILVYESARIAARYDRETILRHKRNILIAMFIGLVAFMAGALLPG